MRAPVSSNANRCLSLVRTISSSSARVIGLPWCTAGEQVVDRDPAARLQRQAQLGRRVPQVPAKEFAEGDELLGVHETAPRQTRPG